MAAVREKLTFPLCRRMSALAIIALDLKLPRGSISKEPAIWTVSDRVMGNTQRHSHRQAAYCSSGGSFLSHRGTHSAKKGMVSRCQGAARSSSSAIIPGDAKIVMWTPSPSSKKYQYEEIFPSRFRMRWYAPSPIRSKRTGLPSPATYSRMATSP